MPLPVLALGFLIFLAAAYRLYGGWVAKQFQGLAPGTVYGNGIGEFLSLIIGRDQLAFAVTFGAMAFSTFVFDTLDICMRLGRYIVQELLGWKSARGALAGTLITVAIRSIC